MASTSKTVKITKCIVCKGRARPSLAQHIVASAKNVDKLDFNCRYCIRHADNQMRLNGNLISKSKVCIVCKLRFPTYAALLVHDRIHTGNLPKKCPICGMRFKLHSTLLEHKERTHKKRIKCASCNFKFHTEDDRYTHVKRAHFLRECLLCNEPVEGNLNYEKHMKQHRIECYACKKRFENLGELEVHGGFECSYTKIVDKKALKKACICKICNHLVRNLEEIRTYFQTSCLEFVNYPAQHESGPPDDTPSTSSASPAASCSTQTTLISDDTSCSTDETFVSNCKIWVWRLFYMKKSANRKEKCWNRGRTVHCFLWQRCYFIGLIVMIFSLRWNSTDKEIL